jgi:hypothetical protein
MSPEMNRKGLQKAHPERMKRLILVGVMKT